MVRREWLVLLAFAAATALAALGGSLATIDAADEYADLEQPAWAPPSWLFGPAWTVLYAMIAVAGWLAWREAGLRSREVALWGIQLAMNALWSPLFFAWGLRGVALAWIVGLDLVVAATLTAFWRRSRTAAWLLVPYMAWILFATALNASVWWLNR